MRRKIKRMASGNRLKGRVVGGLLNVCGAGLLLWCACITPQSLNWLVNAATVLSVPNGEQLVLSANTVVPSETASEGAADKTESAPAPAVSEPSKEFADTSAVSSIVSEAASASETNTVRYPVQEVQLLQGNVSFGQVTMNNKSAVHQIDIREMLNQKPDVQLQSTDKPQVLIYHTHTSEAYLTEDTGDYPSTYQARTQNPLESVVTVGDTITQKLNEAGIVTVHDTTVHDDPAYNGSYTRSLATVEKNLKQYPSLQVLLDIHRDCLEQADKTKLKPTLTVNGKKAAQIMIVCGCDDNGTLEYPDWRENCCFGLHLQSEISERFTGLARPMYMRHIRYNQHLSHAALLLEFGTEANTVEEVRYSAELFADALIAVLKTCTEE